MRSICMVCGLTAALSASAVQARTWSDRSGKFHVEAAFVAVKDGKVYLEKAGGKVITVPLETFSAENLDYLQSLPETKAYFSEHPLQAAAPIPAVKFAEIHFSDPNKVGEIRHMQNLVWGVASLVFSPDGRFLFAGKMDNAIWVYDVDKGVRVDAHEQLDHLGQVTCLAVTPDGRQLLSGGWSGRIQIWDVAEGGRLSAGKRFAGHAHAIGAIYVSPDGKSVISGDEAKVARVWNLDTCLAGCVFPGFEWHVAACFLSRTAKQGLVTDGKRIDLIDPRKGERIQTMPLTRSVGQACAISRDARYVACNELYAIRVWEIRTGKELPVCQAQGIQWSIAFTPNGKYLLSGDNGKVNLWEVATGRKLYEFDTHPNTDVKPLAVSPDGIHFATVSGFGGRDLAVFRLPPETREPAGTADHSSGRN